MFADLSRRYKASGRVLSNYEGLMDSVITDTLGTLDKATRHDYKEALGWLGSQQAEKKRLQSKTNSWFNRGSTLTDQQLISQANITFRWMVEKDGGRTGNSQLLASVNCVLRRYQWTGNQDEASKRHWLLSELSQLARIARAKNHARNRA